MGFSVGSYAKIKEVETFGNYSKVKLVISKKDKKSGKYVCTFSTKCMFCGKAHLCKPMAGQKIQIKNCDVTNGYLDAQGNQKWADKPSFVVYEYELQDGGATSPSQASAPTPVFADLGDDDLPF